jgi:hypothetical protein
VKKSICKLLETTFKKPTIYEPLFRFLCTCIIQKYAFSPLVTMSRSIFLGKLSEYCLFTFWTPVYRVREQGLWHLSNLINIIQTLFMHDSARSSSAKKRNQQNEKCKIHLQIWTEVISPNAERNEYLLTFGNNKKY